MRTFLYFQSVQYTCTTAVQVVNKEMTKKIIVDCCEHCPLKDYAFDPRLKGQFVCTHVATERQIIDDVDIVPEWCMLEDD